MSGAGGRAGPRGTARARGPRGAPAAALAALVAAAAALDPGGARLAAQDAGAQVGGEPGTAEAALSRQLARAVAAAAPAVVAVRGPGPGAAPGAATTRVRSGVVVGPDLVATCASTVDVVGVEGLVVVDAAGRTLPAALRGRDLRLRVVVLRVPDLGDPPAAAAPGARPPGSLVLALGAPLRDLGLPTATLGIVSATGRFEGRADQVDAPLDGSNLGGALVDLEGRVAGVTVHVDDRLGDRSGVGFAVPLPRIAAVLERLAAGDQLEPGFLGLVLPRADGAEPGDGDAPGVLVRGVVPGSPAAAAGLVAGDRVLALAGRPTPDRRAFREAAADLYAGQRITVEVRRGDAARRIELVVGPRS